MESFAPFQESSDQFAGRSPYAKVSLAVCIPWGLTLIGKVKERCAGMRKALEWSGPFSSSHVPIRVFPAPFAPIMTKLGEHSNSTLSCGLSEFGGRKMVFGGVELFIVILEGSDRRTGRTTVSSAGPKLLDVECRARFCL